MLSAERLRYFGGDNDAGGWNSYAAGSIAEPFSIEMDGECFEKLDFTGFKFKYIGFNACVFSECKFDKAIIEACGLENSLFDRCSFLGTVFGRKNAGRGSKFVMSNMTDSQFPKSEMLEGWKWVGCNMDVAIAPEGGEFWSAYYEWWSANGVEGWTADQLAEIAPLVEKAFDLSIRIYSHCWPETIDLLLSETSDRRVLELLYKMVSKWPDRKRYLRLCCFKRGILPPA